MMDVGVESVSVRIKRLSSLLNKPFVEKQNDSNSSLISRETLLDALILLYDECNNEFLMKDPFIASFVEKYRSAILQIRELCLSINDFETKKIICKGRFTEILVAKERSNGNVCVLKKIRKSDILNLQEGIYFENERNLLLIASNHDEAKKWIPRLFYSFQNVKYLYYVMEYCPGGNLSTLAEYYKKSIPEPMLRFYLSEMIQAINSVHLLGFVHRDIKPDNILVDAFGHIKLIDFGSSAKILKNGQVNSKLIVNIPHYTAPEIFRFHDVSTVKGYGFHCDWWSLGIVLFELITGSVPFTSDEIPKLYLSNNYSRKLQYGKEVKISQELKNIIMGLLQPADKRFTYEKLIHLNFFNDVEWNRLHERDAPFVPSLASPEDTSHFSTFEIQRPTPKVEDFKLQRRFTGRNLPFLGFTYLWNNNDETSTYSNHHDRGFILPYSIMSGERRKTDNFDREMENWHLCEKQRHSTAVVHSSEVPSEYSNDSYQSAASVRLENEVTQLHLFYNEKALVIEEKLKSRFHDVYNCLAEDQKKILIEKEQLTKELVEKEEAFFAEKKVLLMKQKDLENELLFLKEKLDEITHSKDHLKQIHEDLINKLEKSETSKKEAMNKLNSDIQKLTSDLDEKSTKLRDVEEKLLNLNHQQAAKLAILNKNKITLRSRSVERDKFEQENLTLKNQLDEANKKISKLVAEMDKKGKMKLDLEFRMTANKDDLELASRSAVKKDNEKREKAALEAEVEKLKEQIKLKDERITDLNEQHDKMNEDLFANLVSIEELKTVLLEKSSKVAIYENEISNLKKELFEKSQQIVNIRSSLNSSAEEKKKLESKIELLLGEIQESNAIKLKEIESNKNDSRELLKQFESTMRDVLKENLSNKENRSPDFESVINTVQRKLSILTERPSSKENLELHTNPTPKAIFEAQIERLESQLEKARENAVLQREAAVQAKKELTVVEKEMSDLKIDLRIAQREAKTAEEQVKSLQRSKYEYYKELKEEKENLEMLLKEEQEKLKQYNEELSTLKQILHLKDNMLNEKDSAIETYNNDTNLLKKKIDDLRKEKTKIDAELSKKLKFINELTAESSRIKKETEQQAVNLMEIKKKEDEWKAKYLNLEKTSASVKETCVLLDKQVEHFENYSQTLAEKLTNLNLEKQEIINKLEHAEEELKIIRKSINEEKSLKLFAENKIRLLESDLSKKEDELKLWMEDVSYKTEQLRNADEKIRQLEEYISTANESMEKGSQYTDYMKREIVSLKQERSELLTSLHRLKEENAALRSELKEATNDLNDLQQANGELQSVLAQVERYHETRHVQDNTTLQQHSKLIEFLQNKYQDATAMKHKRTLADILFRSKVKENLYPKELENLLQIERNKSKGLAEQLYQAQIELMMLKGETISKCSSPKVTSEYESCRSRSISVKNQHISLSNSSESETPFNARLKHNIPHKFETKLSTKAGCKCIVCGQAISFGHKISNCKECHIWSHVSCTVKVGPTCGLSAAMLEQFSAMNKNLVQSSSPVQSNMKSDIEGTIRILKSKVWEKTVINIQENRLCLFDKSKTWEQISFDTVSSVDDDKNMIYQALENVSDVEKRCVLRIVYKSSEKTPKVLYMLASSEDDKINWINILKRSLPNSSEEVVSLRKNRGEYFKGNIICEFHDTQSLNVNQVLQLAPDLCLMAANEGLFSLRLRENFNAIKPSPVKIAGIDKVTKIKLLMKLKFALVICDENDVLKKCDLRMLVSNAEAAECASPYVVTSEVSNTILSFKNCLFFDVSSCNNFLAVANPSYLMLLEWKGNGYDVMKYKRKISSVNCLLFTKEVLLFSTTSEYYSIDLNTFCENKLNLFKCIYESNIKLCEPEIIIKVSADLYLMCDKLFGIFVNGEGKRIKSAETMRWPLPLSNIVYNKPFLCLTHDNSMSLIYLPSSTENPEEKFKFIMIDFVSPSILGTVKHPVRGIFLKEESAKDRKILFLDPIVFMKRNPKQSWSSISTHSGSETTDEDCIQKTLNVSDETEISLNSSILENSYD